MKVLIVDPIGCGLDLALRAKLAGHDVKLACGPRADKKPSRIGDGLVTLTGDWKKHIGWADLVFMTDNARWMGDIDWYHQKGYPIFGPTKAAAEWELDRKVGMKVMRQCGMDMIPSTEFSNYDEAEALVRETLKRYVSKPNGDKDKALSYVSKSPADMCYMFERWKKVGAAQGAFLLQEFVGGVEVAVGGWMGSEGWIGPWCENFEHKKLGNDNTGPNTGEMGTVLKYTGKSQLAEELLVPATEMLLALGYIGYVDISVIMDKKGGLRPMEWTMRPGWPLFNIQQAVHQGDPVEWMADALEGRDTLKVKGDVACGVVVAIPDFPYSHVTQQEVHGIPVYGFEDLEHIHPVSMMAGKAPAMQDGKIVEQELFVSAGDYLLVASGTGSTVDRAVSRAYAQVKELEIPNSPIYRTDIGKRLEEDLPLLQAKGFATSVVYERS
jgi:phosphoribosylamine--glycine ligase